MNVQLPVHIDKPAFLAWVQGRAERYELAKSRVMMMTGGSRGHAIVTRQLAAALERRLDTRRFTVLTSDFGVDLGPAADGAVEVVRVYPKSPAADAGLQPQDHIVRIDSDKNLSADQAAEELRGEAGSVQAPVDAV